MDKFAKLQEWSEALAEVKAVKPVIEREQALRKEVMALFFPAPEEGTNTIDLEAGWKLKLGYKIDRKVDEAALPTVFAQLRELQVNPDPLIVMKPSLDIKVYRSLVEINPQATKVFDTALTIKPGSHTLELVAPK